MGLDDFVAESRAVGDENLEAFFALFLVFVEEFVVGVESGLAFSLSGFGGHAHPFEFAFEGLASFRGLFFFLSHAFGFLVEPRRVVSFPRNSFAAVEFENPTGDVVEEVAVVGDCDDRAGVLAEVLFEPVD